MEVASIYDNGPISPIAKIKDNLAILTGGKWEYYRIEYIEGMPRSSTMTVSMGAIPAGGTINRQVVAIMQLSALNFFHMRFEPIDDVEGVLWELSGKAKFEARNVLARVSRFTLMRDPFLATTSFWVLGGLDRDINLEVRNPSAVYALPTSFFSFWGYRYTLDKYKFNAAADTQAKLDKGDPDAVRQFLPYCTWVPAESVAS